MLRVASPVSGHSLPVSDVPDPVFALGIVGPGIALRPRPGRQVAVAPISGRLVKLLPHAYVVVTGGGEAVLTHLGIDTVHLHGEGFDLLAREGDVVTAGEPVVSWDPALVEAAGRSPVCAVVVLDCDDSDVRQCVVDADVTCGECVLEVDC